MLGTEEVLDTGRSDDRKEPTRRAGEICNRVRHLTRKPQEATGLADTLLMTDPVGQCALKDHNHFVLALVDMNRRSAIEHDTFNDGDKPV